MRNKFPLFLIFFYCSVLHAQNDVCFAYDASGNRIQRASCCASCQAMPVPGAAQERTALKEKTWFAIAPNPAVQTIKLQWKGFTSAASWKITDELGVTMLQGILSTDQIDVTNLPPGKFYLSVQEHQEHHINSFVKIQ